ncbi:MAG: CDP-glucose 4,6-dehydratase, partial [Deltaproteobacteria bacterium]
MKNPQYSFWKDKKVLVTGHTGFKGGWLTLWLKRMGAKVQGIGLPPNTNPNLFLSARIWDNIDNHFCDIRDKSALKKSVHKFAPEVVFHLAGQALVKVGYREPIETLEVNVMGTAYLLQIFREVRSAKVLIMVTSDKVYSTSYSNPLSNTVRCHPYRETDPLGGIDPYSASKAASEMVITSYAKSFLSPLGIAVASVRAGNVLGGGDWAPNRLIPDAIRSWINKRPLIIRNPKAVRPWQHVLDPLAGYLLLAETLWTNPNVAGAFNFGPPNQDPVSVRQVVEMAKKA